MSEKDKICTISGMGPHKLPGNLDLSELLSRIDGEIRKSLLKGCTTFQTGMAMGVDIWAAEIVLKLKTEFTEVRLVCYLPCKTQTDGWPNAWREKYFAALEKADDIVGMQAHYTTGCMQRRNRDMIDASSRLIAVHDRISAGATAQAIRYAKAQGLDVVIIKPLDCLRAFPDRPGRARPKKN